MFEVGEPAKNLQGAIGVLPTAQVEHANILAGWQVDSDIGIERGGRHPLQDGGAHANYLKPYFFLVERVYKSCERRKVS
jgi:hypothetical protein